MLLLVIYALYAIAVGIVVEEGRQHLLVPGNPSGLRDMPGGSIVRLCPESRDSDILAIERTVNKPQVPILNEEEEVFIWGNLSRDISRYSTVDYQINATANTGDYGALNGTFHICDYLEKMHQPPDRTNPKKHVPRVKDPYLLITHFGLRTGWSLLDNGASKLTLRLQRETESIAFKQNSISNVLRNMTVQSVCATHLTYSKSVGCCKIKWTIRSGEDFEVAGLF